MFIVCVGNVFYSKDVHNFISFAHSSAAYRIGTMV